MYYEILKMALAGIGVLSLGGLAWAFLLIVFSTVKTFTRNREKKVEEK